MSAILQRDRTRRPDESLLLVADDAAGLDVLGDDVGRHTAPIDVCVSAGLSGMQVFVEDQVTDGASEF